MKVESLEQFVPELFHAANETYLLNYRQLNKQNLDQILRTAYNYTASATVLPLMQAQFDTYSKDDTDTVQFFSDNKDKKKQVTPAMLDASEIHLTGMCRQLEESDNNLNKFLL